MKKIHQIILILCGPDAQLGIILWMSEASPLSGSAMRALSKRWGFVAAIVVIVVVAILMTRRHPPATTSAIKMSFAGYTNAPNNTTRFALFSLSNLAGYDIRWRGDWVEVEGSSEKRARVVNPALPDSQERRC
jgi:hypothetical protein